MTYKIKYFFSYLFLIAFLSALQTISAEENRVLIPFLDAPPEIDLNHEEEKVLNSNKSIFKTITTDNGKQAVIVFKVNAKPETIWSVIKNYPQYKSWIKSVKESEIYKLEENNIYVKFKIKHWLLGKYQYFINHTFSKQGNWATWTLDQNQQSDFLSSVGFWRVYEIEDQSYVAYSANILFKKKKSTFTRTRAIKSSLKQASKWVKIHSENRN